VKAAENAADAAENALQNLRDRAASLERDVQRAAADAERRAAFNRLNEQIRYQQDEAKAARQHARSLADIRRRAQEEETELTLNRDFAGLFALGRRTNAELAEAQSNYDAEREERRIAFEQQQQDAARQFEFERQQRLIKYQQDLADAQEQYQRELQLAETRRQEALAAARNAYNTELRNLQVKLNQELQARRAAAVAELQLLQQTEAQKLQIQAAYYQQALALLRSVTGAIGAAGSSPVVPAGAGAAAGGGNRTSVGITQNITGSNAAQIANASANAISDVLTRIFG
jgi:DNA repair exonuclease SbcCD ATPase subunit